jgi:hypothetical protein
MTDAFVDGLLLASRIVGEASDGLDPFLAEAMAARAAVASRSPKAEALARWAASLAPPSGDPRLPPDVRRSVARWSASAAPDDPAAWGLS